MSKSVSVMLVVIGVASLVRVAGQGNVATAQQPKPGSSLIVGRVVDGTTGTPVSGAAVTIGGAAVSTRPGNTVLVDSQGRFIFDKLPAGSFTLRAEKGGYLPGANGRERPGGDTQPLVLLADERRTDVILRIWRFASVSGRVTDETGEPVLGAYIRAFERRWVSGRATLFAVGSGPATDDRGAFRIAQLPPGEYIVGFASRLVTFPIGFVEASVAAREAGGTSDQTRSSELAARGSSMLGMPPGYYSARIGGFTITPDGPNTPVPNGDERLLIFPSTFYPNVSTTDQSTPITLAAGERRSGVDLQLRLTPTVKISGVATGPDGPIANLGLRLQLGPASQFWSPMLVEPAQTVSGPNGGFTFFGVPTGAYRIVAAVTTAPGVSISAAQAVTVGDRDLLDVAVTLYPNARITGRVVFEGTSPMPEVRGPNAAFRLDPIGGGFEQGTALDIKPDNTISTAVPPGKYFVRVDASAPGIQLGAWTLKSAIVGGRDVSDVPMEVAGADISGLVVTLTDRASSLSGTARDARNQPDRMATVVVFPTDNRLWADYGRLPRRLRTVRTDPAGGFSVAALPPGEYFAIAIPEANAIEWQRQGFLQRAMSMATRLRIEEGRNLAVDLVTQRWQR